MANFLIRGPVLTIGKRPWSAVIGCRNHKLFDYEGKRRIYGFAVSAIFEIGFSVLVSVAVCGSCSISSLRFRFSAKTRSSFRICHSMQFGVFPVSLRKICASTTGITCTSYLVSLEVFGFDRNLFRFCGFLLLFERFCGLSNTSMCPLPLPHGGFSTSSHHLK